MDIDGENFEELFWHLIISQQYCMGELFTTLAYTGKDKSEDLLDAKH